MSLDELRERVDGLSMGAEGASPLGAGGLMAFRASRRSGPDDLIYRPTFCLVLQGAKAVRAAGRLEAWRAGRSVLIGVDLAVTTRIVEAPYLAVALAPDLALLRDLAAAAPGPEGAASPIGAADADARIAGTLGRLLDCEADPRMGAALGAQVRREVHWWMLESAHGPQLRGLIREDGAAARIARAVAIIRADIAASLRVPALAREAGMSPSAFHAHFKAVTATTPLQFQKRLRLLEAKRLLALEASVGAAAFAVGYESPTQFSRDYARAFGHPPKVDRGAPLAVAAE